MHAISILLVEKLLKCAILNIAIQYVFIKMNKMLCRRKEFIKSAEKQINYYYMR
jgi:replication initiation and membrane attachment protein DnaB